MMNKSCQYLLAAANKNSKERMEQIINSTVQREEPQMFPPLSDYVPYFSYGNTKASLVIYTPLSFFYTNSSSVHFSLEQILPFLCLKLIQYVIKIGNLIMQAL